MPAHRSPSRWLAPLLSLGLLGACAPRAATSFPAAAPGQPAHLPAPGPAAWGSAPPQGALAVVAYANAQVGKPYCYGGAGPGCFDCSGLTHNAWLYGGGAKIPRTSRDIAARLPEIRAEDARAGDILWWPGHVGIYAGDGWVIDASGSRKGVVRRRVFARPRAFRPLLP